MLRRSRATNAGSTPDRELTDADRGRRVVRTIRRVELWTVFRLAACVYLALWAVVLVALALLWWIAGNTGTTDNIESFLRDVGFKNFTFNGPELLLAAVLGGVVLVLAATLLTTVFAALVNLVSELTGGVRLTVIESPADAEAPARAWREPISVPSPLDAGATPRTPPAPAAAAGAARAAAADVPHHQVRAATGTANPQRVRPGGDGVAAGDAATTAPSPAARPALDADDPSSSSWAQRATKLLRGSSGSVRTEPE